MPHFHRLTGSLVLGLSIVATAACSGEPIDDEEAETVQLAEATEELSINGVLEGPLVLQGNPLGAWTYRTLTRRWVQWAMKNPWSTGPVNDPTGEACAMGQSGPVWFLAGTSGGEAERDCTVPAFKPIFFPLVNIFSTPPEEFVDEPAEYQAFIDFFTTYFPERRAATCSLTLRVDGEDVLASQEELDEATWVQILDPFPVTMNDDNYAGFPGGPLPYALTAGHQALLLLPPGQHTVELGGTICYDDGDTFDVGVVYDLHVKL
jgi:hypothetical protein